MKPFVSRPNTRLLTRLDCFALSPPFPSYFLHSIHLNQIAHLALCSLLGVRRTSTNVRWRLQSACPDKDSRQESASGPRRPRLRHHCIDRPRQGSRKHERWCRCAALRSCQLDGRTTIDSTSCTAALSSGCGGDACQYGRWRPLTLVVAS